MKLIHQQRLLNLIKKDKYRVDTEQGCIYSYRVAVDSWDRLQGSENEYGFRQHILYPGRGRRPIFKIYEHVAVWIAGNGVFPANGVITHKDNDVANNKLWNLCLVIPKEKPVKLVVSSGQVTESQADEIWKLYSSGITNHCRIAEKLLIDRQKVRRVVVKFSSGAEFRFDKKKTGLINEEIYRISSMSQAS